MVHDYQYTGTMYNSLFSGFCCHQHLGVSTTLDVANFDGTFLLVCHVFGSLKGGVDLMAQSSGSDQSMQLSEVHGLVLSRCCSDKIQPLLTGHEIVTYTFPN